MTTTQEALDALADKTPNEIADVMREHDIKAMKYVPTDCAIALYLNKVTGNRHSVGICSAAVLRSVWSAEDLAAYHHEPPAILPYSVRSFIHDFDHGRYPDLIIGESQRGMTGLSPIINAVNQYAESAA